jgi:2-iminobutanoate/2-iminopropanoate deaminase
MDNKEQQGLQTPVGGAPYSSAVRVDARDSLLFVSGQLPVDPETGEIASHEVANQTRVAMQNALRVVGDNGSSARDVVKVGIFTTRISEISEINASYLDVLGDLRPARSLVEVSALPRQALVEIEMVARVRGDR